MHNNALGNVLTCSELILAAVHHTTLHPCRGSHMHIFDRYFPFTKSQFHFEKNFLADLFWQLIPTILLFCNKFQNSSGNLRDMEI